MLSGMHTFPLNSSPTLFAKNLNSIHQVESCNYPIFLHQPTGKSQRFSLFLITCGLIVLGVLIPLNSGNKETAHYALAASPQTSSSIHPLQHSTLEPMRHDDDTLAALTIYFEAKGESFAGKLAVAAVIRNRMIHHFHSDGTVRGTVLRPKQFEPWITRNPDDIPFNPSNTKMQESLMAWKLVQDGRKVVNGAVLFYNPDIVKSPRWAQVHRKVAKIGGHEFFHTERI